MTAQSLEERVFILEQQMTGLEQLPAKVDGLASQISQLRRDLGVEATAIRAEMKGLGATLRKETRAGDTALAATLRKEMKAGNTALAATLRTEMKARETTLAATLRKEIREGDEETRRLMRVLHEDLVGRIALLAEHRSPAAKTKPVAPRKSSQR